MSKSIYFSFLILSLHKMHLVHSMKFEFKQALNTSRIGLDCKWKLGKGEKMQSMAYTQDGFKFFEVAYDDSGKPQTPQITYGEGVSYVIAHGGCRATIMNYNPKTMGIYEMRVKYLDKSGTLTVKKKKYKLSLNVDPCKMSWQSMTKDDPAPEGAWEAGVVFNTFNILYVCKKADGTGVGYFQPKRGCFYILPGYEDVQIEESFEMLMGTGLFWEWQGEDVYDRPEGAVKIGTEKHGDIYVGRANYEDHGVIGKITNGFFFDFNEKRTEGGKSRQILVCRP